MVEDHPIFMGHSPIGEWSDVSGPKVGHGGLSEWLSLKETIPPAKHRRRRNNSDLKTQVLRFKDTYPIEQSHPFRAHYDFHRKTPNPRLFGG